MNEIRCGQSFAAVPVEKVKLACTRMLSRIREARDAARTKLADEIASRWSNKHRLFKPPMSREEVIVAMGQPGSAMDICDAISLVYINYMMEWQRQAADRLMSLCLATKETTIMVTAEDSQLIELEALREDKQ